MFNFVIKEIKSVPLIRGVHLTNEIFFFFTYVRMTDIGEVFEDTRKEVYNLTTYE